MSKDGITPEMIAAESHKRSMIQALTNLLDTRIANLRAAPGYTEEMGIKAIFGRDAYLAKATALPAEFFVGHNLPTFMRELNK